jgi:hypothetical protein
MAIKFWFEMQRGEEPPKGIGYEFPEDRPGDEATPEKIANMFAEVGAMAIGEMFPNPTVEITVSATVHKRDIPSEIVALKSAP